MAIMSFKRGFEDGSGHAGSEPKRAKAKHPKVRQHQSSGIDPTWGQKYVFSELADSTTIPRGEEDDFEDDADAMAYLKSVRQQASSIPHLLVAPKVQIGPQLPAGFARSQQDSEDEGEIDEDHGRTPSEADSRGFYEDGAYVGVSTDHYGYNHGFDEQDASTASEENHKEALQKAYLTSVRNRYISLRDRLRMRLPVDAAGRLDRRYATDAPLFGRSSPTTKTWSRMIYTVDPHPVQVGLLSKDSVIRILRVILGGKFLRQGCPIPERTSRWLWALLARLPDQGELNHTEVGWIRDLGRRAILLGTNLVEMAGLEDDDAGGEMYEDERDAGGDEGEFIADVLVEEEEVEVEGEVPDGGPKVEVTKTHPNERRNGGELAGDEGDEGDENDEREKQEVGKEGKGKGEGKEGGAEEEEEEEEEGEVEELSSSPTDDIAMDIGSDSDSDSDEGEIDESASEIDEAALEEAKRVLLSRFVDVNVEEEDERRCREAREAQEARRERERMNMRATLTMIITVAGEFYGQRDLLEFREPFA